MISDRALLRQRRRQTEARTEEPQKILTVTPAAVLIRAGGRSS